MFPTLQIGPLALQTPGLFLLISIWVGLTLAGKRATWHGIESEMLDNLVMTALAGFVIGGRIAYVGLHLSAFVASPLDIFSLNTMLFDLFGGIGTAILAGLVYGQRKGWLFLPTLDALTPFFATLAVGIGASHFASGSAFGKETSLPWAIQLHGALRHPSQVYEIAAALFILSLVGLRKPFETAGKQFLMFIAFTAGASLFLEAFRGDSVIVFGGLRLGQIVAWLVLAVALFGMARLRPVGDFVGMENVKDG
jgi:prolipoprotein diacylglyceryltransferase